MEISDVAVTIVMTIVINAMLTLLVLKYYLWKMNLTPYIRLAKQMASQLGMKGQASKHDTRMKAIQKEAKAKVAGAAISALPMGGMLGKIIEKAGISPEEIFALLQDQDFIKGIKVLMDTFGGVVGKITGKDGGKGEEQGVNFSAAPY